MTSVLDKLGFMGLLKPDAAGSDAAAGGPGAGPPPARISYHRKLRHAWRPSGGQRP